ncbi:hypothetical protein BJ875DRAFT_542871 [Amylocarpus encephaloides]|uniref:Nephrocystin 3-like N-terminal domain-containing protein n=1 Tax=Amylocarpus encephaloides TaxID=45428 RepID=A0A9P7YJ07_9HELO|nr:hypothetical protein BJ875DRAFT_542871 [Amylocarpus encephaloides]
MTDPIHPDQGNLLNLLPFASDAQFNSYSRQLDPHTHQREPTCLPNTRVDLLQKIYNWVDGRDERCIFWLNGLAGTGKSTIASTVARKYSDQDRLGASFFFSRGGGDTIYHFSDRISMMLLEIEAIFPPCPSRTSGVILVLNPLSKLGRGSSRCSYVLVVDALDECDEEDHIRIILPLLAEPQKLQTVQLQVFLTSPGWPSEQVIKSLVDKSSGLFIWAATACRYIREGKRLATKRLHMILKSNGTTSSLPDNHLDEIYLSVLRHSFSPHYTVEEAVELSSILEGLLGSIVTLFSLLSLQYLSRLVDVSQQEVARTLDHIHAILDIPNDQTCLLRLHHPSFRDFLLGKERCSDLNFQVDERQAHQKLANHCITLMSKYLKQDICNQKSPGTLVASVEGTEIKQCLPPEIRYTCLYWVQHLQKSGIQLYDDDQFHRFLQEHLLHWLEALGWIGRLSEGILATSSLEAQVIAEKVPKMYAFVHDAKRSVLYSGPGIEQAPLQLYYSALLFAPEKSIIKIRSIFPPVFKLNLRCKDIGARPSRRSRVIPPWLTLAPSHLNASYYQIYIFLMIGCIAVWNETLALGHSSRRVSFLKFTKH